MEHDSSAKLQLPLFDLQLAYQRYSFPNTTGNETILGMHGWLDNSASFSPLSSYLSQEFLSFDLPGHGLSDHLPFAATYSMLGSAQVMISAIEELQLKKVTLLGHSMGACISTLIAGTFPELVEKLILIDGVGPFSSEPETLPKEVKKSFQATKRKRGSKLPKYESLDQAALNRSQNSNVCYDSAMTLARRGCQKIEGHYTWRSDPRLFVPTAQKLTPLQVNAILDQIKCPTLLILGDDNFPYRNAITEQSKRIKNITTKQLSGSHHVHMENPEPIAEWIEDFLS